MMSRAAGFRRLLTFRTLLAVAAVLALLLTLLHAQQAQAQSGGLTLAVTERSESSLTVQWSQLEDVVTYTVILLGGDEFLVHTASPGEDTYVFTGLQADFQYELSVSAFRSDASSAGEVQIRARTLPPIKPEPTPVVEPEIVPQVSVTAGPEVTEGSDAVFTITADPAPAGDITVELTITAGGDVIGDGETGQRTVTVPASGSATYAVSTVDDGVVESPGTVTATLVSAGGGYAVADTPGNAATVTVTSEDWLLRTPTIKLVQPSSITSEYGPTLFGMYVRPVSTKPLLINVKLSQQNDFYDPADLGLKQWLIPAGEDYVVHEITPIDDSVAEPDGSITLELLPGTGYKLGPYKSATKRIRDEDLTEEERKNYTPEIRVTGTWVSGRPHQEGSDHRFKFASKKSLSSPLPITVEISQIGDFVAPEHLGKYQLTIPAAPSNAYLTIPTVDDQVDEPNGRVVARVLPGDGYVAARWQEKEHGWHDYGSQWIQDNDEVEFTLAAGPDISEGGEAEFTISASEASPARTETIKALVSQGGDFVDAPGDLGLRTLTITTGQSVTLRVATDDDGTDEADGWVSLSIEGAAAQVAVSDDDGGQVAQAGDCVADVSTNCTARVDGKVGGVLDSNRDQDWHGVNLTAGRTYWMKAWGFEAGVYCVYDAQGNCAQEGYLGQDVVFTPEQSGTWFIGVRPSGMTGAWPPTPPQHLSPELVALELQTKPLPEYERAYVLEVTTVTDDYPADATTTGQLSADGSAATGRNETRVDVDWFRVILSAGAQYLIYADSTLTKSGLLHPLHARVEGVYDSGGNLVASGVESPMLAATPDARITPDADGTYYVAVTGNRYNYRLDKGHQPPHPDSTRYSTCLLTAFNCYDSHWRLSLGNGVESSDWHNGGVPYQLSVVTAVDDYADHRDTTANVAVGGSLTGVIDYPGDVDWVAVTLPPGSLYEFKVEGVAANGKATLPDPHFTDLLYAAGGEFGGVVRFRGMRSAVWRWSQHDVGKPVDVVNTDDMGWHRPPASRLFFPGYENIYFIGVTSAENREGVLDTGAYRVSVSIVPQDPEGDDSSTTSALTVDGGAVEAHIDSGGDVDWFAVQLEAGRNYLLGVSVQCPYTSSYRCAYWDSGWAVQVKLADANGKEVGVGSGFRDAHEAVQIEASGTYYLVVRTGFNFHWSGQKLKYNAWASLLPDDEATDDIHTAAVLPPAVKQSKQGEIQYPDDVDWYRVTVQAGRSHTFTAVYNPAHSVAYYGARISPSHRIDGLFDSTGAPVYDNVYFYDERGIKQAYAHTKRSGRSWRELVFEPDADGVYYVAVSGSLGPYQVRHRSAVAAAVPVLSITADAASVAEGGSAEFTLTANPAPTLDLAVSVTVSASGDYGATTGKRTVTVSTGGKATLTVATTGDDADEPDGSVTATLDTPATDAGYKVSAAQGAATVTVSDDDGPALPVISVTSDGDVTEGTDASFTVTASPAPTLDLAVSVTVSASGDYGATTGKRTVTVSTGGKATLTVATTGDDADEPDGSVTATLDTPATDAGYKVSAAQGAATVTVSDDDGPALPVISVTSDGDVTEGADASFTVTANPAPDADLDVSVTVSATGDYGAATGQRTVTIPTAGYAALAVATTGDDVDETNGSVTVTVDPDADHDDYLVSTTQGSATVAVADDDDPAGADYTDYQTVVDILLEVRDNPPNPAMRNNPAHVKKWNRVLAAVGYDSGESAMPASEVHDNAAQWPDSPFHAASVYLTSLEQPRGQGQQQTPEISIAGGTGITEGGDAVFTVTASPAPAANLDVSVTVSQSGDYGATTGQRTVTVSTSGIVSFAVGTTDDSADETDGSVTATVNTGAGYTVSATQGAATVAVSDNDDAPTPEVSVTAGNGVTEGGDAVFTVTASPAPAANLDVSVTVSQSGDYGATTGQRTVTIPTSGSVTVTITTTDDTTDETDGSVTATVNAGSGYTVSSTQGAATVAVSDDDPQGPDHTDYQTVVDILLEVRDNPPNPAMRNNPAHVKKWNRVLAAVGYDSGESAMPASEVHDNAARWPDSPFKAASDYLRSQENQGQQQTPEISIAGGAGITEGGDAVFTVTASPAPSSNLDVSVTVSQSGDYGATTGQRTVTIPTSGSVTLTVGTTDDTTDETDGSVTATVNAGSGYTVSSSQGAATVAVSDNDDAPTPVVSVSAGSGVTEGGDAVFTVTASPAPASNLDVSVTVSQSGDYGATTGQRTVTIPTSGSVTLTVGTTDDTTDETDGSVTATVNTGSDYTVSSSQGAATVAVSDNDDAPTPVVSVSAGSGVTEGGSAVFTVTASPAPAANLDVSVTVSQSGDYGATTGQRTVTIPTSGSVTVTITTTDDTTDEADGSVTATVNAGSDYTVSSTQGAATVAVSDNDDASTPVVSVTGAAGGTEGESVTFTVTASPAPAADLAVSLTVSQSGDYGAATGQRTVTVPTTGSVTFTVGTTDDSTDETDGSVTATVNAGSGYTVSSSQGAATVGVADNDDPVVEEQTGYTVDPDVIAKVRELASQTQHGTAHVNRWNRVLVAFGEHDGTGVTGGPMTAAEAQDMADKHSSPVWDEVVTELTALEAASAQTPPPPTPEVSVTAGSGITEGGDAVFTVTASPAPSSNLDVSVTVSQSGDYGATTGQRTVTIPTTGSVTLTVGTTDDTTDETDGSVTATVNAGSGYTVSSSQGAATVAVSDNDDAPTPVVSVTAGSGVTEGGDAVFTVTASPAPASNLDVSVTVSQSGDYGATTGQRTVTVPTTGSVTLTVGTTDDSADETDGSVTATVNAGSGYTVSSTQGAATVGVADNDDAPTPVVSVTAGSGVTEGGDVVFTVTASPAPASNLAVSVTVSQSGDYGATTGRRTVTVPTSGSVTLTVGTTDDTTDETDGSVIATVNAGSGYTVSSSQGAATVGVSDNDDAPTPVVSVTAGSGVTEGGDAVFTVTAIPAPAANLAVSVTVSQSGDYGATTGHRTVTIPTTGSVTLTVGTTDDTTDETDGSVTATVNAGSGYTVSSTQGAATVGVADNDDAAPEVEITVTVEAASAVEGDVLEFRVRLSEASTEEIRIRWNTAPAYHLLDDRAHMTDYQYTEGELVFAPGVTELTAEVWLEYDDDEEPDEYFVVEAYLPGTLYPPDAVGTMTIIDDD